MRGEEEEEGEAARSCGSHDPSMCAPRPWDCSSESECETVPDESRCEGSEAVRSVVKRFVRDSTASCSLSWALTPLGGLTIMGPGEGISDRCVGFYDRGSVDNRLVRTPSCDECEVIMLPWSPGIQ